MLKEYAIRDLLSSSLDHIPYYIGTFEDTPDAPEIDWPHRHAFYTAVWFTQGSGFYVIDFQEYAIVPGRIFLVNPKQIHNWDYAENSKGYVLMIDAALALELKLDSGCCYLDLSAEAPFFKNIFIHLIAEQKRSDALSVTLIKSGIAYLYGLIKRNSENQPLKASFTSPTLTTLQSMIAKNPHLITVRQYAHLLQVTEEQLNYQCKKSTGISVKQFILDAKITESKRQLIYSEHNINEIAYGLGFEDASYFARIFRKKTTFSPSDFLKKYRKQP